MSQIHHIERLNYFFREIYGTDIDMSSFDGRIKVQKLVYILKSEGTDLGYNFTWYIRGPYSPKLADDAYAFFRESSKKPFQPNSSDLKAIEKISKAKEILKNSNNAELLASYLYLKKIHGDKADQELEKRKPRFNLQKIRQITREWQSAIQ